MSLTKISGFLALTSYLGLGGAATVLKSNPRTLAIIAATGFFFDLIQANNRTEVEDAGSESSEPEKLSDWEEHFPSGGAGAAAGHDSNPRRLPDKRRLSSRAGGLAAPRSAPYRGKPGILAKLANRVSKLFHSVCGGVSWVSQRFHIRNTFAYQYVNTFYILTRNFYNNVLPEEYQ